MLLKAASAEKEDTGGIRRQEVCTMVVSICKIQEGGLYGHILHGRLKLPVPYRGTCDLVLKADAISKQFRPCGSDGEYRCLRDGLTGAAAILPPEYREEMPEGLWKNHSCDAEFCQLGTKEAFCLQILERQNYSLQGRLRGRLTGGKYVYFRSGMELMHMLSTLPEINKNKAAGTSRRRREGKRYEEFA